MFFFFCLVKSTSIFFAFIYFTLVFFFNSVIYRTLLSILADFNSAVVWIVSIVSLSYFNFNIVYIYLHNPTTRVCYDERSFLSGV